MSTNEKKSVLIFCDLNSCGGGVYIYTQQITRAFLQSGVAVYIISHEPQGAKEKEFLLPLVEGVSGYHLFPNKLSDQEIVKSIVDYAAEVKPTWYFPNYREGAHAAMVPLKKMGVGNIFVGHNDHDSQYRYAFRYQSVVDIFICPSKKCEAYLFSHLNKTAHSRVKYIPHCVDINMANCSPQKTLDSDFVKLLYCGRINFEQKKLNLLPLIMKSLQLKGVNAEVNIVGSGSDRAELEELFKKHELKNVYFHGHVDRKSLIKYFNDNDIVILTSLYEGFCLALAEAMACGLPAVAFECGGVIDDYLISGENGYIVPFGDMQEFSNKIQRLVNNKNMYHEFSVFSSKKIRDEFSWNRFLENYKVLAYAQNDLRFNWPLLRSIYFPVRKFGLANLIDFIGTVIFKWNQKLNFLW